MNHARTCFSRQPLGNVLRELSVSPMTLNALAFNCSACLSLWQWISVPLRLDAFLPSRTWSRCSSSFSRKDGSLPDTSHAGSSTNQDPGRGVCGCQRSPRHAAAYNGDSSKQSTRSCYMPGPASPGTSPDLHHPQRPPHRDYHDSSHGRSPRIFNSWLPWHGLHCNRTMHRCVNHKYYSPGTDKHLYLDGMEIPFTERFKLDA